jgi:putative DNA primase/helicase
VLEGFAAWQAEGLNAPSSVKDATGSFRSESDTVGQFVESACQRKQGARTLSSDLFKGYREWCANSSCEPVSSSQFGKSMTRLGFEVYKTKSGNGRCGIELASPALDADFLATNLPDELARLVHPMRAFETV